MLKTSNKGMKVIWVAGMFAFLFAASAIISPILLQIEKYTSRKSEYDYDSCTDDFRR